MLSDDPLIGGDYWSDERLGEAAKVTISSVPSGSTLCAEPDLSFDSLISMPPEVPQEEDIHEPTPPLVPTSKSKVPTGTRKNLTPSSPVAEDAPTQPRK